MLPIYTRPRRSPTHTTLQADAETWREAARLLRHSGLVAYAGLIEPFITEETEGVIQITFLNNAADTLLRSFGLSA